MKRTNSEIKEYKNCRQRHHFGYVDLLAPIKPHEALRFGSAIHTGLETFHSPEDGSLADAQLDFAISLKKSVEEMAENGVELWDEDHEQFAEEERLGIQMLKRYHKFNHSQPPFSPVVLERPFEVKVRTPKGNRGRTIIAGKMDGIVELEGELWLLEHKTAKAIDGKYISALDLDDQINTYLFGARESGYDIKGVIYNVLAKWVPKAPKLLKSGKLSTDKRQKTTHQLFLAACEDNRLNPLDYQEIIDHLSGQEDDTFYRAKVYRSAEEFDRIGRELYAVTRDMSRPEVYRNPGACRITGCSFKTICLIDSPEGRAAFRKKTQRHEELPKEGIAV